MAKPITIIPRHEWGALPPKATEPIHHPNTKVVLTYDLKIDVCKTKEECLKAMQELQTRHMNEENSDDIKYNFLVGGDGKVYEGRGWHVKPCKSLKYPNYYHKRLDIGFIGNYIGTEVLPSKILEQAFHLMEIGIVKNYMIRYYDLYEIRDPATFKVDFDPDRMELEPEPIDEVHDCFDLK